MFGFLNESRSSQALHFDVAWQQSYICFSHLLMLGASHPTNESRQSCLSISAGKYHTKGSLMEGIPPEDSGRGAGVSGMGDNCAPPPSGVSGSAPTLRPTAPDPLGPPAAIPVPRSRLPSLSPQPGWPFYECGCSRALRRHSPQAFLSRVGVTARIVGPQKAFRWTLPGTAMPAAPFPQPCHPLPQLRSGTLPCLQAH